MSTPFDAVAPQYKHLWSDTGRGRSQRAQVWRYIDPLFRPGDRVLDLGCGTGDDALHLAARGVQITGIDTSEKMVEIAQARGVDAQRLALQDLHRLDGPFSGAISNFGVLNCVADMRPVVAQLARLVSGGGAVAICIMGRFAPVETIRFLCKLDWRRAARRWLGRARWRGIEVFYHSGRKIRRAFDSGFVLDKRASIGWGDHQLYIFRRTVCR